VLGVGVNNANARNFTYLASTGMTQFHAIPRPGSTAVDDLAWADGRDVLIAMTCRPYRAEVVEAVAVAREQGLTSSASPTAPPARSSAPRSMASSWPPTRRNSSPPRSRPSRFWRRS
jgi:DNA-binding MurR/RpiR family transcriptional regulator